MFPQRQHTFSIVSNLNFAVPNPTSTPGNHTVPIYRNWNDSRLVTVLVLTTSPRVTVTLNPVIAGSARAPNSLKTLATRKNVLLSAALAKSVDGMLTVRGIDL